MFTAATLLVERKYYPNNLLYTGVWGRGDLRVWGGVGGAVLCPAVHKYESIIKTNQL